MLRRALVGVETGLFLVIAWVLVFWCPLRWARRLFGPPSGRKPATVGPQALARARGVAWRVKVTADRLPWASSCLVRAVAGCLLLERRGIRGGVIRFGVSKVDGRLTAHAWLLLGGDVLLGADGADTYTPVADFGRSDGGAAAV